MKKTKTRNVKINNYIQGGDIKMNESKCYCKQCGYESNKDLKTCPICCAELVRYEEE
jgi:hypothetical protein